MAIPFTQYLRPDGRRLTMTLERPADIEALAARLMVHLERGLAFECALFPDGDVILYARPRDDEDAVTADDVATNGEDLPAAIDQLIRAATALLEEVS